jgi:hypothetical protein
MSSRQVELLRALLVSYDEEARYDHTPEDERAKMTQKLRFQVMVRDSYTCQICGVKPNGQDDTAVLHIDHIFPVSKGGRTELNNLTTLCDKCNSGKSDEVRLELLNPAYYLDPPVSAYYNGMKPRKSMPSLIYYVGQQPPDKLDNSVLDNIRCLLLFVVEKISKFQRLTK